MKTLTYAAATLVLLSVVACAPSTPTADPAMIQASAVAAANAMVAMTQAAIPTATQIPPTPLPSPTALPSPTLFALPTLSGAPLPPPVGAAATGDACSNAPMSPKPAGPMKTVKIANNTGGSVILSLYLNKTAFGECGYRSFNMTHGAVVTTDLPQGCYAGGAFITGPKDNAKAFGSGCLSGPGTGSVSVNKDRSTISIGS